MSFNNTHIHFHPLPLRAIHKQSWHRENKFATLDSSQEGILNLLHPGSFLLSLHLSLPHGRCLAREDIWGGHIWLVIQMSFNIETHVCWGIQASTQIWMCDSKSRNISKSGCKDIVELTCHHRNDTTMASIQSWEWQKQNKTHLVLEPRKVGVMAIVHLPFVINNCKKIILVHRLGLGIPNCSSTLHLLHGTRWLTKRWECCSPFPFPSWQEWWTAPYWEKQESGLVHQFCAPKTCQLTYVRIAKHWWASTSLKKK